MVGTGLPVAHTVTVANRLNSHLPLMQPKIKYVVLDITF